MKYIYILISLIFISNYSQAQTGVITTIPMNATNLDSVNLVFRSGLPQRLNGSCGELISQNKVYSSQSIEIDLIFDVSPPSNIHGCYSFDTVRIRPLPPGTYLINSYWSLQDTINNVLVNRSDSSAYNLVISWPTAIQELEFASIKISPNPVSNFLSIQNPSQELINQIEIWDLSGRLVKEMKFEQEEIDVSELASGVYVLRVLTNRGSKEVKLVKQ
jgi:hypothetical protein